ncbi:hypothetical protein GCM10009722_23600 [Williamsia deligens]
MVDESEMDAVSTMAIAARELGSNAAPATAQNVKRANTAAANVIGVAEGTSRRMGTPFLRAPLA